MQTLLGLVVPVRVRHVYACDLLSVEIINSAGGSTGDDLTVRLPVRGKSRVRPCDPPLIALSLFDDQACDGHTSDQPGPCPEARDAVDALLESAKAVHLHMPIPDRREFLQSLVPGRTEEGDIYYRSDDSCGFASLVDFLRDNDFSA